MDISSLKITAATLITGLILLNGCSNDFREVTAQEFQTIWESSLTDSAVSWWYVGENNGYNNFIEKRPFSTEKYAVRATESGLKTEYKFPLTQDSEKWLNLKTYHFKFN